MQLTAEQEKSLCSALLGPPAEPLIALMFGLVMRRPISVDRSVERLVQDFGLVQSTPSPDGAALQGSPRRLTPLGYLVGDSIREYKFWRERDRRLPCEGRVEHLSASYFEGKSLLEVGCGMGCNLMSIGRRAARLAGVEPVTVYRQMSRIFCQREALPFLEIEPGTGEELPFANSTFDTVLCVSSHQYMDVRRAFSEMARVLAPGGELIIVGGTLDTYVIEGFRPVARGSLRGLKDFAVTIANTLSYSAVSRRVVGARARGTTAFPVYPLPGRVARWLTECGLTEGRSVARIYPESCFSYVKSIA